MRRGRARRNGRANCGRYRKGSGRRKGHSDYLLLTDADIEYARPTSSSALLAQAAEGFDLVSVMVRLRCESVAEKLLIPAFVFFFFKLYPPAWNSGGGRWLHADPRRNAGAYRRHREYPDALIDDCALAQKVAAAGGKVWLGVSDLPVRSVREYGSARDIRAMICALGIRPASALLAAAGRYRSCHVGNVSCAGGAVVFRRRGRGRPGCGGVGRQRSAVSAVGA
jgi:hypothetical protein